VSASVKGDRLAGKVVLITGGASGIGLSACEACAQQGAVVVMTDVNTTEGELRAAELETAGLAVNFVSLDVSSEEDWAAATAATLARHGRLDVLINNAGFTRFAPLEVETLEGWRQTQAVNTEGVFLGTQHAVKAMQGHPGSIVNVSSIEGLVGGPMLPAYNAAKGAVRLFSKSVALFYAGPEHNIRVNSLHPGYVATPPVVNAMASMPPERAAAMEEDLKRRIPMGRIAQPAEIAAAVVFLASDESSYMTGSELVVDGGYTAA
jgi:NAD(P)-dependent dehydrogenase (short-subunit alcohol dehydrogenase family)